MIKSNFLQSSYVIPLLKSKTLRHFTCSFRLGFDFAMSNPSSIFLLYLHGCSTNGFPGKFVDRIYTLGWLYMARCLAGSELYRCTHQILCDRILPSLRCTRRHKSKLLCGELSIFGRLVFEWKTGSDSCGFPEFYFRAKTPEFGYETYGMIFISRADW